MIIIPNTHCKKVLKHVEQPIVLLEHYVEYLIEKTSISIATNTIIDYELPKLHKNLTPEIKTHINYILEHDLINTVDISHPNTQWIIDLTHKLLETLKKHHLIHPKSIYQYLSNHQVAADYEKIQHYGFSQIPKALLDFFKNYNITPFVKNHKVKSEHFYQYDTQMEEVSQAISWLKDKDDAAIVYLEPSYQPLLISWDTQVQPSTHEIEHFITQANIKLPIETIHYLHQSLQYPNGLHLLSYIQSKHYPRDHQIEIPYISTNYPKQISDADIDYQNFHQIYHDVLLSWNLQSTSTLPSSLQYLNIKMSYKEWLSLCTHSKHRFHLPIFSAKSIQGACFTHLWILGAHQNAFRYSPTLHWIPSQYTILQNLDYLISSAYHTIHSSQIMDVNGQANTFYRLAKIEYPKSSVSIKKTYIEDSQTPSLDEIRPSINLIQDYASCPFKAFAKHRLLLECKKNITHDMERKDYGIIMHQVLEKLYANIQNEHDLHSLDEDYIDGQLRYAWRNFEHPMSEILKDQMKTGIKNWLNIDQNREFKIQSLEHRAQLTIGDYTLKIRIDRVDKFDDATVLIDYKTGNAHINDCLKPGLIAPQMLLYALTQENAPIVAFAKPLHKKAVWQTIDFNSIENYLELAQSWREQAFNILRQFQNGLYPVKPANKSICDQCDFMALCRIREQHAH
jgi:hypothetical protein